MVFTDVDFSELRESMSEALDLVMVHRAGRGLPTDREAMTRIRESFEDRILQILAETDEKHMPSNWTWKTAAVNLSWLMAIDIVRNSGDTALPARE